MRLDIKQEILNLLNNYDWNDWNTIPKGTEEVFNKSLEEIQRLEEIISDLIYERQYLKQSNAIGV